MNERPCSGTLEEGSSARRLAGSSHCSGAIGRVWRTISRTHTRAGGRFRLRFTATRTGHRDDQCRISPATSPPTRRLAWPAVSRCSASPEPPGTAAAELSRAAGELTSSTLGVANRTLPCGTLVTLRYDGRTVRVPVIDRRARSSQAANSISTEATKQELGFGATGDVWTTS